jgi:hypothetical protein
MNQDFLANIITTIFSISFWQWLYSMVRIVFIIFDIALIFGVLYVWKKSRQFYPPFVSYDWIKRLRAGNIEKESISVLPAWSALMERARLASPEAAPLLLIEADKLVDDALKQMGVAGDTMLERLQRLVRSRELKTLESFWRAHKVRNNIAHTPNYSVSRAEIEKHLASYGAFLKELGCL